jgi:hypothetical protein
VAGILIAQGLRGCLFLWEHGPTRYSVIYGRSHMRIHGPTTRFGNFAFVGPLFVWPSPVAVT